MAIVKLFPEEEGLKTVVVYKTRPTEGRTCSQAHVADADIPAVSERLINQVKNPAGTGTQAALPTLG